MFYISQLTACNRKILEFYICKITAGPEDAFKMKKPLRQKKFWIVKTIETVPIYQWSNEKAHIKL